MKKPCLRLINIKTSLSALITLTFILTACDPDSGGTVGPTPLIDVKAVAVTSDHTVVLKNDGTIWAWGDNYYGQLGNGTTIDSRIAVQAGTDSDWIAVSAGGWHEAAGV